MPPHGLQHTRLPCPSLSPRVCSNSSIESVMLPNHFILCAPPFSVWLQSFPVSGTFPVSQLFASGGQSVGALASASVLPMNIQSWFLLGLTSLISLQPKELSSLLQHHSSKTSILWHSAFFMVQFSHPYMTTGKTVALTTWAYVHKALSLPFNTPSRFVLAFLSRSRFCCCCCFVFFFFNGCTHHGAQENKIYHCIPFSPFYLLWGDRTECHDLSHTQWKLNNSK